MRPLVLAFVVFSGELFCNFPYDCCGKGRFRHLDGLRPLLIALGQLAAANGLPASRDARFSPTFRHGPHGIGAPNDGTASAAFSNSVISILPAVVLGERGETMKTLLAIIIIGMLVAAGAGLVE